MAYMTEEEEESVLALLETNNAAERLFLFELLNGPDNVIDCTPESVTPSEFLKRCRNAGSSTLLVTMKVYLWEELCESVDSILARVEELELQEEVNA